MLWMEGYDVLDLAIATRSVAALSDRVTAKQLEMPSRTCDICANWGGSKSRFRTTRKGIRYGAVLTILIRAKEGSTTLWKADLLISVVATTWWQILCPERDPGPCWSAR